jgi:putative N-acetylmannosamine-6-phosphate epimerase
MKQYSSLANITPQIKDIDQICEIDIDCTGVIPASKRDLAEISAFIKKEKENKNKLQTLEEKKNTSA